MIDLPLRRLRDDAIVPTQAYPGDAGLDLSACERVELGPGAALGRTPADEQVVMIRAGSAGAQARSVALKSLNHRRKWAEAERRAIEAFMRFDGDGYLRFHGDAKTYIRRAQRYEKEAQKLFKAAGVTRGSFSSR